MGDKLRRDVSKEAAVMAALCHPNVVTLYGACLEDGNLMLVMERMGGGSLHKLLNSDAEEGLSLLQRVRLMLHVARGLQYLHSRSPPVLHRDLKSHNVLLSHLSFPQSDSHEGGPVAKLSDFGLSTLQLELQTSSSGGIKGTRRWHAPELVQRRSKNTMATDVWALGLLCVEVVTGALPYGRGETEDDVESNLKDKDAQNLDLHLDDRERDGPGGVECIEPLRTAIDMCLQRDPAKRAPVSEVVLMLEQAEKRCNY